jgi:hypothetical protein
MLFGMGHAHLSSSLAEHVKGRIDAKEELVQQKQDKKNAKIDDTWDKAQSVKKKDETKWNVADLKIMVSYKSRKNDSPQQKNKTELAYQWNTRRNRESPQRLRASDEGMHNVVRPGQPWFDKGSAMMVDILPQLTKSVQQTLNTLSAHLRCPFLVLGSWPALKIMESINSVHHEATLSTLKANDIDVYHGLQGNGECEILTGGITKYNIEDVNFQVNNVPVKNFDAQ